MTLKSAVKKIVLGPPGARPRKIKLGLLKGLKFQINNEGKSSRLLGIDEREIAGVVGRYGREARTACDVGMNDGWYALYFASLPNMQRVYGYEPDPSLQALARSNFQLNSPEIDAKVTVRGKFVGLTSDEKWCTLDDELASAEQPIMLKIDVDGGELDVLKGAEQTLKTKKVLIVLETHTLELEQQCTAHLEQLGYETQIIMPGWYRAIVPETRVIPHNRWFSARKS